MTAQENPLYVICESKKDWHRAIKMDLDKCAPHFVTIKRESNLRDETGFPMDVRECAIGDRLIIEKLKPLVPGTMVDHEDGPADWSMKSGALVYQASVVARKTKIERLAIAVEVKEKSATSTHYRYYDPHTMTDKHLPRGKDGPRPAHHSLIRMTFIQHEAGTWVDQYGQRRLPPDYAGKPERLTQLRAPMYEVHSWKLIPEEEQARISTFLTENEAELREPALIDDLLLAGAAAMQASIKKDSKLQRTTFIPSITSHGEEIITFEAEYEPLKKFKRDNAELKRAAKILREDQQILVAPTKNESGLSDAEAYATIIRSEPTAKGTIMLEYAIPTSTVQKLWTDVFKLVGKDVEWTFKPSPSSIITPRFRELLQQRAVTAMRSQESVAPAVRIIEALLGKLDALPPPEEFTTPFIHLGDFMLTDEQAEGVGRMTCVKHALNMILAPAGSGKTTTITAIIQELLNQCKEDDGIIVTTNMNIAIEGLCKKLAHQKQLKDMRILVLQSPTYLSGEGRTVNDEYHKWRLPELLRQLAEGELDPTLDRTETELAKKAAQAAKYRFHGLEMDWSSALKGADDEPGDDDYSNGVKLLLKKYRPQVILGTIGTLKRMVDILEPAAKRLICDESGTVSTMEIIHLLTVWKQVDSVMLVGDLKQIGNFTAPLDQDLRKYGFDSVLARAAAHPHAGKTILTEVYRSHPAIVRLLSEFAYADTPLKTLVSHEERDLMEKLGIHMKDPKLPIIVINCVSQHTPTLLSSFTNQQQEQVAAQLATMFASKSTKTDVRLMTLYGGLRDDLRKTLSNLGITYTVANIDACQGQEVEVSIVATAISPLKDGYDAETFVGATERITVAISRAKHGLILLANVEAMSRSPEWRRLFKIIEGINPDSIVTPKQFFGTTMDEARQPPTANSSQPVTVTQQALALSALGLGLENEEGETQDDAEETRKRNQPKQKASRKKQSRT